jgi:recombination protein RecT
MAGQITKAMDRPSQREQLRTLLERNRDAIALSLPNQMDEDRFVRLLTTAANTNPALLACEPLSFLAAGVTAATLGLEPNDPRGHAYLIPYNDRQRGKVVKLIIGYKGLIDLARRSGQVSAFAARPVFEGDGFIARYGTTEVLEHDPKGVEDPDKLTHAYAIATVMGDRQFEVMTRAQIDRVKDSSPGAKSAQSPWHSHYAEMATKTAVRRLCKLLPQTVEVATALTRESRTLTLTPDGTVKPESGDDDLGLDADVVDAEVVNDG